MQAILSDVTNSVRSGCDSDRYRRDMVRVVSCLYATAHLWPGSPISRAAERNAFASLAVSANVQAGAFGKRFSSSREGASSCAWPGTSTKSTSRLAAPQAPRFAAKSALERPRAWLSPLVLRLNRRLKSSVCSVALRAPPSDVPADWAIVMAALNTSARGLRPEGSYYFPPVE